jgi:hypothetical protein
LSSRYTATNAQSTLPPKAGQSAPKRLPLAVATAVAAAGIGVAAAFAGSSPVNAVVNPAKAGHAASGSFAGHSAATAVDAVMDLGPHTNATPTKPQLSGLHLVSPNEPAPHGAASTAATVTAHTIASKSVHGGANHTPAAPSKTASAKAASAKAASAKAASAKAASARQTPVKPAPAKPVARLAAKPAPAKPRPPYLIYDSVTPTSIPAHQHVATYANGAYAASASSVAGRGNVLWIDTNGSDPKANVLDVEPGDATPAGAAVWVHARLGAERNATAIVYTMLSDWQQVKANVGGLPSWMQSHVRYWIADPTGVPHVVPGSNATQWYWGNNYDITTANPGF